MCASVPRRRCPPPLCFDASSSHSADEATCTSNITGIKTKVGYKHPMFNAGEGWLAIYCKEPDEAMRTMERAAGKAAVAAERAARKAAVVAEAEKAGVSKFFERKG